MKLVIGPTSSITAATDLVPAIPYEERPVADIDRWVMPWLAISSRGFAARYSVTAGFATVCSETLSPGCSRHQATQERCGHATAFGPPHPSKVNANAEFEVMAVSIPVTAMPHCDGTRLRRGSNWGHPSPD
ncbi:hypothetical protein [Rhodococcus sp. JS3073]|uniref:hypothetical protein n=1 Tax=Rhodococcus sp. JS3073 TaxID=3002901 RepID=UPI00228563F6|nr:hypothetical protein [Rhodococcus sp. JS3073]WAM19169.1 hypothetical protein OYT95_42325 [Rhodococcus sp. JS3073]